ncbi:TPA: hypothetical protein N0F65_003092 [Lagenidium giganteum]|uniref:Peptidase S74 domain-containing protein n=1 Tax=Lagenidium giganteum TaxID=4803 RepID=A0AAV2YK01_9STRA|nr:TPA: hypothetical protein N0F65_003092 [Lagenidium giganteum]
MEIIWNFIAKCYNINRNSVYSCTTKHCFHWRFNITDNTTSTSTFRLTIQNSGDILNHNASAVGLKLGGTLITSSATELHFLSGATAGTASASKALVVDSNRSITNIAKIYLTGSDATTTTGTTNASAFGLNILATTNANGQYNAAGIAFRNALSDGMPHGVILCQRTAAAAGGLVFLTQSATKNLSETLRCLSTGAVAVNATANAGITCFGSANYVDDSYQKVLDLQSNNVQQHQVQLYTLVEPFRIHLMLVASFMLLEHLPLTQQVNWAPLRCKDIIGQLDTNCCDKFYDQNVYEYKYKGSDETIPKIGFISQELYAAGYINLLSMTPNENLKKVDEDDIEGYQMNIDYSKITAINFCMIKKLLNQVKQLEMELKHNFE